MFVCPSCGQRRIGLIRRFTATPAFPTQCSGCGAQVHPSVVGASVLAVAPFPLLLGSVVCAIYWASIWWLLLWPASLVVLLVALGLFGSIEVTDPASVRSERKQVLAIAVAVVLILALGPVLLR